MSGVYAVNIAGFLKVGQSIDVEQRVRQLLSTTGYRRARLIGVKTCWSDHRLSTERRTLRALRYYQLRGEWHLLCRESVGLVKMMGFVAPTLPDVKLDRDTTAYWMRRPIHERRKFIIQLEKIQEREWSATRWQKVGLA
jgi:hypothetical protein